MEPTTGFEPVTSSLPRRCSTTELRGHGAGNEARTRDPQLGRLMLYQLSYSRSGSRKWWGVLDLNQRRLSRRVYSPLPLTARATPQDGIYDLRERSVELAKGLEPATC